jgi:hypothetical protein
MSVFAHKQFYRNISWLSLTELCFKLLSFVFFIAFTRTLGEFSPTRKFRSHGGKLAKGK